MAAQSIAQSRFVRRTQLSPDEYHKNFHKLDRDVIGAVTSAEADSITPLMSKIYLRLLNAPQEYWEREGVLRFSGEEREGNWATAWDQLVSLLGVASGTARKALTWMSGQGILGYFAGKNGVGIRVFINRATSSIGRKAGEGQKNLRLVRTSSNDPRTSIGDMPFRDSFADLEISDTDIKPSAPKNGADKERFDKLSSDPAHITSQTSTVPDSEVARTHNQSNATDIIRVEEIVLRLRSELEPSLRMAAQAAAAREHERTREWLETRGLPKAARVAQREAYNILRQNGVVSPKGESARADLQVGRNDYKPAKAQPLSPDEIKTYAEMCVAMLETHGQGVDVTLSELSSEAGGPVLPEDASKVRAEAEKMIDSLGGKEQ